MGEPNKKLSKEAYQKLMTAFEKSVKDKNQFKAAKVIKKKLEDKVANEENDRRRGVKPSGFPVYKKGGYVVEYSKGGKMEYKNGGKLGKRKALDFNKDGKITKEDFAMLRAMSKKKKGKK